MTASYICASFEFVDSPYPADLYIGEGPWLSRNPESISRCLLSSQVPPARYGHALQKESGSCNGNRVVYSHRCFSGLLMMYSHRNAGERSDPASFDEPVLPQAEGEKIGRIRMGREERRTATILPPPALPGTHFCSGGRRRCKR